MISYGVGIMIWRNITENSTVCETACQDYVKEMFMMTSWNGIIFRITGPLCGEFTGHLAQRPVTRGFDVFSIWVNNRRAGDLRRYRAHYDVTVMVGPLLENSTGGRWFTARRASNALSISFVIMRSWNSPFVSDAHFKWPYSGRMTLLFAKNRVAIDF